MLGGAIQVDALAVAACLERKIPVSFLGDSSRLAGVALPSISQPVSAEQRIERFLSSPDWGGRYADWLRAATRSRLLLALDFVCWEPPTLVSHGLRQDWEARFVPLGLTREEIRRWIAFDQALLGARCGLYLSQIGMEPAVLAAGPVLAPADWIAALGWQSYADLEWLVRRLGSVLNDVCLNWPLRLTEFAETRARRDDRRIAELWASFLGYVSIHGEPSRSAGVRE